MKLGNGSLIWLLVTAALTACSHHPHSASQRAKLDEFKTALVAYIDEHPGCFIGRSNSEDLKAKPLVRESENQCALGEFTIFPATMRFRAQYGWQGPEPYVYEGEFTRAINGSLQVSNVKLTRLHIAPTNGLSQ
jgi:hypothetical protein